MSALLATAAMTRDLADDIRSVAGLASLTLALIGFFTTLRFNQLRSRAIGALSFRTFGYFALPELLMLLVALFALVAMAPLLHAFSVRQLGHSAGALPAMFALIWTGFALVAVVELVTIVARMSKAVRNKCKERRASHAA